MKKHVLKSKTNWVQIPFAGLAGICMAYPEAKELICGNASSVIALHAVMTIIARNVGSNVRIKSDKTR